MTEMSEPELTRLVETARHLVDQVTPDIQAGMSRAEIGELAMGVGLRMAAQTLRSTGPLDVQGRAAIAEAMDAGAARLLDGAR